MLQIGIGGLLRDGSWVDRRIHTLSVDDLDANSIFVTRRVSISVNRSRLSELLPEPVPDDGPILLPIGLYHKDLLLDFDVTDQAGSSLAAVSRAREARFAAAFAISCVPGERPSHVIWSHVHKYVSSLQAAPEREDFQYQLSMKAGSVAYSERDRAWIDRALASSRFLEVIEILREHHVLVVSLPLPKHDFVVKVRRREMVPASSLQRRIVRSRTARLLRFEIADHGWAISDHVRVVAQSGTNVSGLVPTLVRMPKGAYKYVITGNSERRAVYRFSPPSGVRSESERRHRPVHTSFIAGLRPAQLTRDAAAAVMAFFIVFALIFGGVADLVAWQYGQAGPLSTSGNVESIITLTFVSATLFMAYVFRQGENQVREYLLRTARRRIVSMLIFPWLASAALFVPDQVGVEWLVGALWIGLGVAASTILIGLYPLYKDIRDSMTMFTEPPWVLEFVSDDQARMRTARSQR